MKIIFEGKKASGKTLALCIAKKALSKKFNIVKEDTLRDKEILIIERIYKQKVKKCPKTKPKKSAK